jgi:ribosomal protein S18 acetylase RimI-like enzyme
MKIRKIEEKDLEALADLFVLVFNAKPWSENWTKQWAYERLDIIFKSYRFYGYIAEVKDESVGAVFSRIGSYKGELELEVVEMFVSGQQQRKGIGTALLDELKYQAKKDQIVCVVLQTDKTTFAKDFYHKYGFKGHDENLLMTHIF